MNKKIKVTPGLMFFGDSVDATMKLDDLKAFLKEIHAFINNTAYRLSKKKIKGYDYNHEERLNRYEDSFRELLYESFIVSLVIFLEQQLNSYCVVLYKFVQIKLRWKQIRGSILERFREYVSKLSNIHLSVSEELRKDVEGVIALRNCLVHCAGRISDFSEANKIRSLSNRYAGLRIDEGQIYLTMKLCSSCIYIIKSFIDNVYKDALTRFPKR